MLSLTFQHRFQCAPLRWVRDGHKRSRPASESSLCSLHRATGLCAAARLSRRLGLLQASDTELVESLLTRHALPVRLHSPLLIGDLLEAMAKDKKARAGAQRFIVMKSLGSAAVQGGIDGELVKASLGEIGAL